MRWRSCGGCGMLAGMGLGIALVVAGWLLFAACAVGNARGAFAARGGGEGGRSASIIPFVGGIAGAFAAYWTCAWLAAPAWLGWLLVAGVAMLDPGTGPYLLVLAAAGIGGLFGVFREQSVLADADQHAIRAAVGCLLGTALGDAVGLATEGLSRRRLQRMYPAGIDGPRLLFGLGLCSDDTEHSCLVAQSIVAQGDSVDGFTMQMRSRLRWWLAALPAGVGLATLRAILKLWLFVPRRWQGVYSAGNGPAMRSALLGVLFADRIESLRAFVHAGTVLTHRDPKAECAALAVALAARESALARVDPESYLQLLARELEPFGAAGAEFYALAQRAGASAAVGEHTVAFAAALGLGKGVSAYAFHTVPVCLQAWLRHPCDFRSAVLDVVACGGDTDTAAAITGGIVGAGVGREGLPERWLGRLVEWPASVHWMHTLAENAARRSRGLPLRRGARAHFFFVLLARNLLFLVVVLAHGFRRLLPPY
jgi:ADP-ribosylglycohydrolase